ncbi:MAG: PfkB family carbohydrate kinase [Candidatus Tenebribacter burtonii]|nr:PfkB family carbohydrate kinase [Candidatus Tenebribacter burtonii]
MKEIIKKFKNQKIAVIGDLILDKYVYGEVDRISPEAPVPIVRVLREKYVPGGAANVAANISTLGGNPFLFGIVGNDQYKDILLSKTAEMNIPTLGIITDNNKTTIRKTRVIGLNQQLLRIDYENTDYIETHVEDKFIYKLKEVKDLSAIIISDYAKGAITKQLILQLIQFSKENDILLIVDPKPKHKEWYSGSTLVTPNKKEAQEMSGIIIESEEDLIKAGKVLVDKFDSDIIITAGADGMYVFERLTPRSSPRLRPDRPAPLLNKEGELKKNDVILTDLSRSSLKEGSTITTQHLSVSHIPTIAKEVYDVSGAGDTVIAVLALALSCGATLNNAAILANHAAGIKVGKIGTAPIFLEELVKEFQENK